MGAYICRQHSMAANELARRVLPLRAATIQYAGHVTPGMLSRVDVERILTRCADETDVDIGPLLTLLRRFAAEAAREEARMSCEELVAA